MRGLCDELDESRQELMRQISRLNGEVYTWRTKFEQEAVVKLDQQEEIRSVK